MASGWHRSLPESARDFATGSDRSGRPIVRRRAERGYLRVVTSPCLPRALPDHSCSGPVNRPSRAARDRPRKTRLLGGSRTVVENHDRQIRVRLVTFWNPSQGIERGAVGTMRAFWETGLKCRDEKKRSASGVNWGCHKSVLPSQHGKTVTDHRIPEEKLKKERTPQCYRQTRCTLLSWSASWQVASRK